MPSTVIAKMHSLHAENQGIAMHYGLYTTEAGFYTDCAHQLGVRVPRSHHAAASPDGSMCVLLLEDMVGEQAEVRSFSGLLVDFARAEEVDVIVKGLRAVSDFDYELQMAQMNRTLSGVETVFMATNPAWGYLSSSLVREVARLGGSVEALVPANVAVAVKEKLR